jgi:hypothetical protein
MNTGRTIFAQLMDFVPLPEFRRCVDRYQGDYKIQSFSSLDQFLCLAFAQLTYRESLRDIEACLRVQQSKLYHMGFRGRVSRSTLAYANEHRDWRIIQEPFKDTDPAHSDPTLNGWQTVCMSSWILSQQQCPWRFSMASRCRSCATSSATRDLSQAVGPAIQRLATPSQLWTIYFAGSNCAS